MKDWLKELFHNAVVHPLMCFLPLEWAETIHDKNAEYFWPKEGG